MQPEGTTNNDLLSFVSSLTGGDGMRVEESLGSGYVRLRVSEAERRQAKHDIRCVEDAVIELLRNARDADARHIFVATSREGDLRTVIVVDDGTGIPPHMQQRVFEARVTSKLDTLTMDQWGVHGRGMALFSIKECAQSARVCWSDTGAGCALEVCFDVNEITGRCKQCAGKWEKTPHFIATAVNSPGIVSSSHAGCSSKRFKVNPLLMMAFIISLTVYLLYRHLGNCFRVSLS